MIETIFSILAACITIYVAGLLIREQNKNQEKTKELEKKVENSLKEIEEAVTLLTNEPPIECTLTYLELRMESLNKCINLVKTPKYRRNKYVKCKKNFTDD